MKRSKAITLTLLTGASLFVAGCSEDPLQKDLSFFQDKAACQQKLGDEKTCAEVEQQAIKTHAETAPKFSSVKDCEDKFGAGNCGAVPTSQIGQAGQQQTTQASGGSFMPLMLGYMAGRFLGGGGGGLFGGGQQRGYQAEPVYKDKNNSVYGRGGASAGTWGKSTGFAPSTSFKSSLAGAPIRSNTMKSGGFGNSSHMSASS